MATATLTLTDFLLARIAEDAKSLPGGPDLSGYVEGFSDEELRRIAAEWSAWERRWAAESDAKRRMFVALASAHAASEVWLTRGRDEILAITDQALRLMALPYADHPDYRGEWKP